MTSKSRLTRFVPMLALALLVALSDSGSARPKNHALVLYARRGEFFIAEAKALGAAQMFAALTDAQRAALVRTARPCLYGAGEAIVREGDAGSSMFVIVGGEAAVTIAQSKEPVARLNAGDVFGEMSLLTGDPRAATVTAATDCHVIELTAEGFRSVAMAEPIVADLICTAVEKRRTELEQHRASAAARPPAGEAPPRSLMARMRQFLRL